MSVSKRSISRSVLVAALAGTLAACGGSPSETGFGGNDDGEPTEAQEVYAKFADMPVGKKREQELVQACEKEGEVSVGSSANAMPPVVEAFEEAYPKIDVSLVEPTSSEAQRKTLLQEYRAGKASTDVVNTYATDLKYIFSQEGVTSDYDSPVADSVPEELQSDAYIPLFQYNTEIVPESERPTSYADLGDSKWADDLGLVRGDGNWYFAMYDYFTNEKGMSADEFAEMFRNIAGNARAFDGHGTASLVAAGEIPVLVNGYQNFTVTLQEEGAQISSEPHLEPIVMLHMDMGLLTHAEHPACGVLFAEWAITDGQEAIVDANYYPSNPSAVDKLPYGLDEFELAYIPVDELDSEKFNEWLDAFERLIQGDENVLPDYVQ